MSENLTELEIEEMIEDVREDVYDDMETVEERLDELLDMTGIPVTRWHGDVAQSHKKRLLDKNVPG